MKMFLVPAAVYVGKIVCVRHSLFQSQWSLPIAPLGRHLRWLSVKSVTFSTNLLSTTQLEEDR